MTCPYYFIKNLDIPFIVLFIYFNIQYTQLLFVTQKLKNWKLSITTSWHCLDFISCNLSNCAIFSTNRVAMTPESPQKSYNFIVTSLPNGAAGICPWYTPKIGYLSKNTPILKNFLYMLFLICSYEISLIKNLNQPNYHNQSCNKTPNSLMSSISFNPFFWISPPPFYKSLQFYNNSSTHFSRNAAKQVKRSRFYANQ